MKSSIGSALIVLTLLIPGPQDAPAGRQLVVCGWDEVFVLDLDRRAPTGLPEKSWSWRARDAELPEDVKPCSARPTSTSRSGPGARS
jgi:hypothetical protein